MPARRVAPQARCAGRRADLDQLGRLMQVSGIERVMNHHRGQRQSPDLDHRYIDFPSAAPALAPEAQAIAVQGDGNGAGRRHIACTAFFGRSPRGRPHPTGTCSEVNTAPRCEAGIQPGWLVRLPTAGLSEKTWAVEGDQPVDGTRISGRISSDDGVRSGLRRRHRTAIDHELGARDRRRTWRRQKGNQLGHLDGLGRTAQGDAAQ